MNATLHAHFRGASVPGFAHPSLDFVERQVVRLAAQVCTKAPLRKCAKPATEVTHVCIVDVAVNNVGDSITGNAPAQVVCRAQHCVKICAAALEQARDVRLVQPLSQMGALQQLRDATARLVRPVRSAAARAPAPAERRPQMRVSPVSRCCAVFAG
jgi:hypothetical protein